MARAASSGSDGCRWTLDYPIDGGHISGVNIVVYIKYIVHHSHAWSILDNHSSSISMGCSTQPFRPINTSLDHFGAVCDDLGQWGSINSQSFVFNTDRANIHPGLERKRTVIESGGMGVVTTADILVGRQPSRMQHTMVIFVVCVVEICKRICEYGEHENPGPKIIPLRELCSVDSPHLVASNGSNGSE